MKIDLGRKNEMAQALVAAQPEPTESYPSLSIYGWEGQLPKFPKRGRANIEFEVESQGRSERDGKVTHDLCLRVKSIDVETEDVEPEPLPEMQLSEALGRFLARGGGLGGEGGADGTGTSDEL